MIPPALSHSTTYTASVTWQGETGTTATQTFSFTTVGTPPANVTRPTITGTPEAGQTLTCLPGSWNGTPPLTYSYQWSTEPHSSVASSNQRTDLVAKSAGGTTLTCTVTVSNKLGVATAQVRVQLRRLKRETSLIRSLALAPRVFRAAQHGPTTIGVLPHRNYGALVSYSDSGSGSVTFVVFRLSHGRYGRIGSWTHDSYNRKTKFVFTGRLRDKTLPTGSYRLEIASPHGSNTVFRSFTIR